MTDRVIAALILALIVESAHWVRLRWDFNDAACSRAWHLSALGILATIVMIWLEGNPYTAIPRLLGWLPPLLLPLQFIQSFSLRPAIPLNTLSFFARKRRQRNLRLGLGESPVHFNFGNAYFVVILLSSTLGPHARPYSFLPGILLLTGWALLSLRRSRPSFVVAGLLLAGLLSVAGQFGLRYAHDRMTGRYSGERETTSRLDPNTTRTAIGTLGELKATRSILWRLDVPPGQPAPRLLRTAGYNRYNDGVWRNHIPPESQSHDLDFQDLDVQGGATVDESYYLLRPGADASAIRGELPRFNLRGSVSNRSLLPLPGNTASLRDFPLDGIERNSLGTVRIFPQHPVIEGLVLWNDHLTPESPPWHRQDLYLPENEREMLREVLALTGVAGASTLEAKLQALRSWFHRDFTYTRYLSIPPPANGRDSSALATFLTTDRRGHCEYFATSATLLLREAGIPARYTVGFAAAESNPSLTEITIRGVHSHAWCRAWDENANAWIDFDPTPPSWLAADIRRQDRSQWFADAFHKFREDFFLWRNRTENQIAVSIVVSILSVIALIVIIRRLSRSRHIAPGPPRSHIFAATVRTPLHELESTASRILGKRPPGLPFSRWLLGLRPSLPDPSPLDEAISLHQQLRFDPAPPSSDSRQRLENLATQLAASLRTAKNEPRGRR